MGGKTRERIADRKTRGEDRADLEGIDEADPATRLDHPLPAP